MVSTSFLLHHGGTCARTGVPLSFYISSTTHVCAYSRAPFVPPGHSTPAYTYSSYTQLSADIETRALFMCSQKYLYNPLIAHFAESKQDERTRCSLLPVLVKEKLSVNSFRNSHIHVLSMHISTGLFYKRSSVLASVQVQAAKPYMLIERIDQVGAHWQALNLGTEINLDQIRVLR